MKRLSVDLQRQKAQGKSSGALILGKYLNGEMVFCGHTGGGFNDKSLSEV
jgi:bifunctional non-homologous end joining protein LigD